MFDGVLRELRRLEGRHRSTVEIPSDAEGYLDRECPASECLFGFKVQEEDWRDKVREATSPARPYAGPRGRRLHHPQRRHHVPARSAPRDPSACGSGLPRPDREARGRNGHRSHRAVQRSLTSISQRGLDQDSATVLQAREGSPPRRSSVCLRRSDRRAGRSDLVFDVVPGQTRDAVLRAGGLGTGGGLDTGVGRLLAVDTATGDVTDVSATAPLLPPDATELQVLLLAPAPVPCGRLWVT